MCKYLWNEMDCNRKKNYVLWDLRDLRNNYNHEKGISRLAIIKIWYNPLKELWPLTRISETTSRFQKQRHKVWTCNNFEIILVFIMLTVIIIYYYHPKFLIYFADAKGTTGIGSTTTSCWPSHSPVGMLWLGAAWLCSYEWTVNH